MIPHGLNNNSYMIISHILQIMDTSQPQTITIKLSGDGARFSKSSNIILLSFSFPGHQSDVLSATGITAETLPMQAGSTHIDIHSI